MEVKEAAIDYTRQKYSVEEYLEMENAATEKHEYYQGEIFAMSRAKLDHNIVTTNVLGSVLNRLKGKPCRPFSSDLRIYIEKNTLFTYPDISVICGEVLTLNNDKMNALNPTVIFEVLSPSTAKYDLGSKFTLYRDIPTLREYVIIDPLRVYVESHFINDVGNWELIDHRDISDGLSLRSLGITVSLNDIYEGVVLM